MLKNIFVLSVVLIIFCQGYCDTFTDKITGKSYDGYMVHKQKDSLQVVRTDEGVKFLDLSQYDIERNRKGRTDKVVIVELDGPLQYVSETDAFNEALIDASDAGPLFVLIKIDSPGGRLDLCAKICETIEDINNCDIYAYIGGGKNGGAYSAAAAVALACDKIYMSSDTAIGAATPYQKTEAGVIKEADPELLKSFAGFFHDLAAEKGRPGILAAAMVDKDVFGVEIDTEDGKKYVWPKAEKPDFEIVKIWTEKGMLLTMPAGDAAETGICDGIFEDMDELIVELDAIDAKIMFNKSPQKARLELQRADKKIDQTYLRAQDKIKKLTSNKKMSYSDSYQTYYGLIRDVREAIALAEQNPDLAQNQHLPGLRELLSNLEKNIEN